MPEGNLHIKMKLKNSERNSYEIMWKRIQQIIQFARKYNKYKL